MSRVGKVPVDIPKGVTVNFDKNVLKVKGPKGEIEQMIKDDIEVKIDGDFIEFNAKGETKRIKSLHGLYRNLASNMVEGVTNGFEKKLELIGVGYDAELRGSGLFLEIGYSHAIYFKPPDNIEIEIEKPKVKTEAIGTMNQYLIATITVKGINKELVGQIASKLRKLREPDVYKCKGIRYKGEIVHLKPGKAGVGA